MRDNKKKDIALIASLCMAIIIISALILSSAHDRIDIISEDDIMFRLHQAITSPNNILGSYLHPVVQNLAVVDYDRTATIMCNNRESLAITIQNRNPYTVKGITLSVQGADNIGFEFPPDFVIPPGSERKITYFIDAACSGTPRKMTPTIRIEGTDIRLGLDLLVTDRRE